MRIEIVNERLLPRFGVDRLLILLAKYLVGRGHEINFTCLRCDQDLLDDIGQTTILPIPPGLDMRATEYEVARLMRGQTTTRRPDAVVSGGWPFFRATRECADDGIAGLFIDAGATAQDGMDGPARATQMELRRIRRTELPGTDRILPISRFIHRSQTIPDRGHGVGVRTILLGSDHLERALFPSSAQDWSGNSLLDRLRAMKEAGSALILVLGRFEAHGYKNSTAAYTVLQRVALAVPDARLLVLDAGADCLIPAELAPSVISLGRPDDATLLAIMELCALGLSPSLWEGFNLPIVEMQRAQRPALAFALGAHPEVIAHPWLLCVSIEDMIRKTIRILTGLAPADLPVALQQSRQDFPWSNTLARWEEEILGAVEDHRSAPRGKRSGTNPPPRVILADVTNASIDPANSGVMRVTRQLLARLQTQSNLKIIFVRWVAHHHTYYLLNADQRHVLARYGGPVDQLSPLAEMRAMDLQGVLRAIRTGSQPPILFTPEVIFDGHATDRLSWARGHGMMTSAVLYDLIPVDYPAYCAEPIVAAFPPYLAALSRYDHLWSISGYSTDRLEHWTTRQCLVPRAATKTLWLPGQFGAAPRVTTALPRTDAAIRILTVSTLEPRKNHAALLAAWRRLRQRRPDLDISLTLVGNHYAYISTVFDAVRDAAAEDPSITYRGVLSDQELREIYADSNFTIYPSLVEGFGLPILESLWLGRPCLTHQDGVMAELAAPGGCLMTDMRDPAQIADAVERLATDPDLLARLEREATAREISTWRNYATLVGDDLSHLTISENAVA